jgi:hypothetical protein
MTIRSIALFAHVLGMLALFIVLALEWLTLELVRTTSGPEPPFVAIHGLRVLPRFTAIAVGLILLSGIYLAARVGVLEFAWVRVSFAGMVLMGVLGAAALRPMMRNIQERSRSDGDAALTWRYDASHPFLHASLRIRVAVGLAIVYLMIAKPGLLESTVVIGLALVLGVGGSIITRRSPISTASEDIQQSFIRRTRQESEM